MIRVVTVAGEYGSGRAEVGQGIAAALDWKLVDKCLIDDVAHAANVDPQLARQYDEVPDPWLYRLHRALWRGGYEGVASTTGMEPDADSIALAAHRVIEQAAHQGNCVIVGRGAQCVLQRREDTFHIFVYAPRKLRIARVLLRDGPGVNAEERMDYWDRRRRTYIRQHFDQDWTDRHLYDMMICSSMGEDVAAAAVLAAIRPQIQHGSN